MFRKALQNIIELNSVRELSKEAGCEDYVETERINHSSDFKETYIKLIK